MRDDSSGLTKTVKTFFSRWVSRGLGAFGQNNEFIYSHRKGIGIPLFVRDGIAIPINNVQPNK
jgi:hypothetical protein